MLRSIPAAVQFVVDPSEEEARLEQLLEESVKGVHRHVRQQHMDGLLSHAEWEKRGFSRVLMQEPRLPPRLSQRFEHWVEHGDGDGISLRVLDTELSAVVAERNTRYALLKARGVSERILQNAGDLVGEFIVSIQEEGKSELLEAAVKAAMTAAAKRCCDNVAAKACANGACGTCCGRKMGFMLKCARHYV